MKKIIVLSLFMVMCSGLIFAEDIVWGSMYDKGNFRIDAAGTFESKGNNNQIALYPEAEMILWKPVIAQTAFIDVGAAVKGRFGLPLSTNIGMSIGAGLLGTVHFGFRGFDFPGTEYLERIDLYAEAGVKFDFITNDQLFGLALKSGVNYFINDSLSVGLHYSDWGSYSGGGLNVALKLGKKPEVKGFNFEYTEGVSAFAVQPYLLQFYTLFYAAHYAGGFYPENYKEGQATIHRVSVIDGAGDDSYTVERALLMNIDDDKQLWSLRYADEDDSFYYEYVTDINYQVKVVYYESDSDGVIEIKADTAVNPEAEYLTWNDYGAEGKAGVEIKVEGGTFITTEYFYTDESGVNITWWLSDKVPGSLVSYKMEDDSDIVISELVDVTSRNKAVLYK